MRLVSAFWLRFEDSPAPFLRFGSLRFETCVLRLELRFGCVLKTVLHFSCVLKLRLELRFEPLRSAFAFRATLSAAPPVRRGCTGLELRKVGDRQTLNNKRVMPFA